MTCDMAAPGKTHGGTKAAASDSADNSVVLACAAQAYAGFALRRETRLRRAARGLVYCRSSMFSGYLEIVIQGVTASGQPFRPSDWAERLCGVMSAFSEDRYLSYSPYVRPVIAAGVRCVLVDVKLEEVDPAAFRFLLDFANDNELKVRPGRRQKRPEEAAG